MRKQKADVPDPSQLQQKLLQVHERLCAAYRCPIPFFSNRDPLSLLVSSLLSHRTKNADTGRAVRQLHNTFDSWEAIRDAPVADVQAAISAATWPELKAPRIQQVLRLISERVGALSLDCLSAMAVSDARGWLESLPGVGPKTSAQVLLVSNLRRKALPVDSHHYRVASRLGLIPLRTSLEKAHRMLEAQLPQEWTAQQVYDNHEVLMLHGQQVCFYHNPACHRCVVLDFCPFGQARMSKESVNR